jgi:hypothetical protein
MAARFLAMPEFIPLFWNIQTRRRASLLAMSTESSELIRAFRLFVSSMFSDFGAEQDVL